MFVTGRFDRLLKLVDAGLIRVLDLEFVTNADGVARTVPASQAGPEFSLFEGAASGLLDRDDLDAVAARLAPGATAAVLVYEELSILGVIEAWEPPVPESFPKAPSTSTSSTLDCKEHDHVLTTDTFPANALVGCDPHRHGVCSGIRSRGQGTFVECTDQP
ncbi:MAG TPA: DUF6325 family protein [Mycobacterium sp.]|nr:DUF6325 family protein [Mycobacterium sp.]